MTEITIRPLSMCMEYKGKKNRKMKKKRYISEDILEENCTGYDQILNTINVHFCNDNDKVGGKSSLVRIVECALYNYNEVNHGESRLTVFITSVCLVLKFFTDYDYCKSNTPAIYFAIGLGIPHHKHDEFVAVINSAEIDFLIALDFSFPGMRYGIDVKDTKPLILL